MQRGRLVRISRHKVEQARERLRRGDHAATTGGLQVLRLNAPCERKPAEEILEAMLGGDLIRADGAQDGIRLFGDDAVCLWVVVFVATIHVD